MEIHLGVDRIICLIMRVKKATNIILEIRYIV